MLKFSISKMVFQHFGLILFFKNNLSFFDKFILTNIYTAAIMKKKRKEDFYMYKKSITHYIAKSTIDILFYLSIIGVILVPFFTDDLFRFADYSDFEMITLTVTLFTSGICCIYILFYLKKMYTTLLNGSPFIDENVSHFRKISVGCFATSVIYVIKCLLLFTFGTLIIAAVFAVGCLFCLTLKDLFKQAINYKAENDLTV